MKRKELNLEHCNLIKVLMMFLVVIYHCMLLWGGGNWFPVKVEQNAVITFICNLLKSVHIYTFAFVSGFLFYYLRYEKGRYNNLKKDTKDRAKRLLIPYIIVAALWVIPFNVYYFKSNLVQVLRRFVVAEAPNQLWFLIMLFMVFMLCYVMGDFFKRSNFINSAITCIIFYIIGFVGGVLIPNVFQVWTAFKYLFFYWLGFYFRKEKQNIFYKIPFVVYLIIFLLLFSIYYFFLMNKEGIGYSILINAVLPVISVLGVLTTVIGISSLNTNKIRENKIYNYFVKHNFTIYLFHQQLIYIAISILNGKAPIGVMIIVNFIFALTGCIIISHILCRIPKVKNLFGYK